ncbi:hypothetical protein KY349_00140 [Candidatus Woesearchaeota archaeon]|jgi:hypothetical protein|nr:hypothetical protein [Candidatus Woesearchaeota archaeon]
MADVKKLFKELHIEVLKISLLHASADSIIFFMVALNITTLLDVRFYFALTAALLFMLGDVMYRMKKTTLKDIEKKNPQVDDILRTAKDNTDESSFMVLAMFEDLIQRMKSVSAASILNQKNLMLKIVFVCALSFSVIIVAANNIHVPKSMFDPDTYYQWFSSPGKERLDFYTIEFNESDELIYGEARLAKLGNRTIELHITPSINEMSFAAVKDPEEKEFERGTFPTEIAAVSDASSEEKLPKESKIAIAYNLKLKET